MALFFDRLRRFLEHILFFPFEYERAFYTSPLFLRLDFFLFRLLFYTETSLIDDDTNG